MRVLLIHQISHKCEAERKDARSSIHHQQECGEGSKGVKGWSGVVGRVGGSVQVDCTPKGLLDQWGDCLTFTIAECQGMIYTAKIIPGLRNVCAVKTARSRQGVDAYNLVTQSECQPYSCLC